MYLQFVDLCSLQDDHVSWGLLLSASKAEEKVIICLE